VYSNNSFLSFLFLLSGLLIQAQVNWDKVIDEHLREILLQHREFVSIPNIPQNREDMLNNMNWVADNYSKLGFKVNRLESSTLPLLFLEKQVDPKLKTVLFYFHIDGQPIEPKQWDQEHPFTPVLKQRKNTEQWETLNWNVLNKKIDDEWRIFARAAADDKAPIIMLLKALSFLDAQGLQPKFNIKIIFDPEEEYGSEAFLSTLNTYKPLYHSDAMIIMDGPAHESNKPTLTFGCRGIATCTITTYGAKLPQHSGHFGNYVPNPVFNLSHIISSMKDETGRVLIKDFYSGIVISEEDQRLLQEVPDDKISLNKRLGIAKEEQVGNSYQEALQFPSLNVRQISTSWKGDQPKTVIPEIAVADIDVRLVVETDARAQLDKIKSHIKHLGYTVLDHDPTDNERNQYSKIVKFTKSDGVNAFRTELNSDLGIALRTSFTAFFKEPPIQIRSMGGTVPIISAIKVLDIPAIIIPTVNMDNNQHSPNENIRIGNIRNGIKICLAVFHTNL
jgi:acetylornithine deacetylase/succinyl-diaminopimelate desuccinylase-like protein